MDLEIRDFLALEGQAKIDKFGGEGFLMDV